jgi:hypothetical protein
MAHTMVGRIARDEGIDGISNLVSYVERVIAHAQPSGLARPALFMLIANLSLRCGQTGPQTLWQDLYDKYSNSACLTYPQNLRTVLDTICYMWCIQSGPVVSTEHMTEGPEIVMV